LAIGDEASVEDARGGESGSCVYEADRWSDEPYSADTRPKSPLAAAGVAAAEYGEEIPFVKSYPGLSIDGEGKFDGKEGIGTPLVFFFPLFQNPHPDFSP